MRDIGYRSTGQSLFPGCPVTLRPTALMEEMMSRNNLKLSAMAGVVTLLAGQMLLPLPSLAADGSGVVAEGKAIALSRKKGNCLACHMIEGGEFPGNLGPPLIAMKARYPDKQKLRAQIWDPTAANPESAMVPFGRFKILTEAEMDKLVEYIWTL
jgi:sulfur-oxidizing protein SoxX